MNSILRYVVTPWEICGMGVESFAVLEQWVDREQITAGGAEPVIFKTREAAKAYATQKMKSWPYRAEVVSQ